MADHLFVTSIDRRVQPVADRGHPCPTTPNPTSATPFHQMDRALYCSLSQQPVPRCATVVNGTWVLRKQQHRTPSQPVTAGDPSRVGPSTHRPTSPLNRCEGSLANPLPLELSSRPNGANWLTRRLTIFRASWSKESPTIFFDAGNRHPTQASYSSTD